MAYNCNVYKVCRHESLSVEEAYKRPSRYMEIILNDENFPSIGETCTNECKEKMIKIVQIATKHRMNELCWYFHDAKFANYRFSTVESYKDAIMGYIDEESGDPKEYFDITPKYKIEEYCINFEDYPNVLKE